MSSPPTTRDPTSIVTFAEEMSSHANGSLTMTALETQAAAKVANTTSPESPATPPFPSTYNSTTFKLNPDRPIFTIQTFKTHLPQEMYENSNSNSHIHPPTRDSSHHPSDEARLDHLRRATAKENLSRLCPDFPWDSPHRQNTTSPSPTITTPITASLKPHNDPEAPQPDRSMNPKTAKQYPPYVFIPDTQRRAHQPAYFGCGTIDKLARRKESR